MINTPLVHIGDVRDVLSKLPEQSVHTCVTSPPYWGLRDYGTEGQLGLESTPEAYIENMVDVFRAVWRVLRDDGTLWLNLGDSYAGGGNNRGNNSPISEKQASSAGAVGQVGSRDVPVNLKPKDLVGIPWRVALALQADGWYLRSDIIWSKPNPMPESVTDRPTKSHEYLFLMAKKPKYYYDAEAIKEEATDSTSRRLAQDIENQTGSTRVPGKTNGNMKAVGGRKHDNTGNGSDGGSWQGHSGYFNKNGDVIGTPGYRNKRTVWQITTQPYKEAHFATFPEKLVEPCILAGCPEGGTVLDPFVGSGTTLVVAEALCRQSIGIDINPEYLPLIKKRLSSGAKKIETKG